MEMDELSFKKFLLKEERQTDEGRAFSDMEVANMYFGQFPSLKVRDIAGRTGRSVAEVYRIIHRHGKPNRLRNDHDAVLSLAASGMNARRIAELTGYTPRNISYILHKHSLTERL